MDYAKSSWALIRRKLNVLEVKEHWSGRRGGGLLRAFEARWCHVKWVGWLKTEWSWSQHLGPWWMTWCEIHEQFWRTQACLFWLCGPLLARIWSLQKCSSVFAYILFILLNLHGVLTWIKINPTLSFEQFRKKSTQYNVNVIGVKGN